MAPEDRLGAAAIFQLEGALVSKAQRDKNHFSPSEGLRFDHIEKIAWLDAMRSFCRISCTVHELTCSRRAFKYLFLVLSKFSCHGTLLPGERVL